MPRTFTEADFDAIEEPKPERVFTESDFDEPKPSRVFTEADFEQPKPKRSASTASPWALPSESSKRLTDREQPPAEPIQLLDVPKPEPGEFAMLPVEEQRRITEQLLMADAARKRYEELHPSRAGTLAREAAAGVIPGMSFAGGFALGAPLGAVAGPLGALATGTVGGMLASSAASDLQDLAAQAIAPESAARFQDLLEAGRQEYPYTATAGRLVGSLPAFEASIPRTLAQAGQRAVIGGGLASVPAVTQGRLPTTQEALEGALGGMLLGEPRIRALRAPITTTPKGEPNARSQQQAAEVYGDVRSQPIEGQQEVPPAEGGGRVQSQAERGLSQVQAEEGPLRDVTATEPKEPSEKEKGQEEALREAVAPAPGAAPVEAAPGVPPLRPALMVDGKPEIGQIGETHRIIQDRLKENPERTEAAIEAFLDDDKHVFVDQDGKVLNRKEAAKKFDELKGNPDGTTKKLQSEQLGEVTPAAATPERLAPAIAEGQVNSEPPVLDVSAGGMAVGIAPPGTELAQALIAKAGRTAQGIKALVKSQPTRKIIDQTFDAADNKANIAGSQAGKSLRIGTNRLEREAAMAIVEANGDPARLAQFEAQVAGKDDAALAAVRYARQNWQRLQPLAQRVSNILDSQLAEENANGVNTEFHDAYVPHIYDQDLLMGRGRPYVLGGGGGKGPGSAFKKGRSFANVFEAIEAGYKPKSLDVAELVEHRVKAGNRLVNRRMWAEGLKQANDPTDGQPVITDVVRQQRGPGGSTFETAPPGYSIREIVPGHRLAIHNGYTSLIDALTGTSRISGSLPGKIALEIAGGIKHGLLAFDTFHASRVLQKELFLKGTTSLGRKGSSLLEYSDADLGRAVNNHDITSEMADWVRANRANANQLLDAGLNVGRIQEALYTSIVRQLPILGKFNKWVFEKLTRGAMLESGLVELERIKRAQPELSDKEVALKVSRDLNAYFGNLGKQGLFKSKQAQDIANLIALAPQWVESMARTEVQGAGQLVKGLTYDPAVHKAILTGTIGKGVAQGLLAYFIGTQLLNLATRKQFTWDNQEEGHKLDAWIPDLSGKGGNGFFISPLAVVAELTHDMMRYAHKEGSSLKAAARIASNKASPLWRAGKVLLTGKDYTGQTIDDTWNRVKAAAWALAPLPIPAQAPLKADYPGQTQRQITSSLGFKTEPAESAVQQINSKADRFLKGIGKPRPKIEGSADEPSYNKLRNALRRDDKEEANKLIADLAKTRSEKQIAQTMKRSVSHPFTGSKADEGKFIQSLSDEEYKIYEKARDERLAEYQKFLDIWQQ